MLGPRVQPGLQSHRFPASFFWAEVGAGLEKYERHFVWLMAEHSFRVWDFRQC